MCLAIYKPAGTAPDWDAYRNGFDSNPDGWGFAVIDNGEMLTACGMSGFDDFRANLEPFAHCQAIIHFRWATHGAKNTDNCHPFFVDDLAVIHNGIVEIDDSDDKSKSDTWHFVTKVVAPMYRRDRDFFMRPEIAYTQEMAHASSKFVFLRQDGAFFIWNKDDGVMATDGHWYSNRSFQAAKNWAAARPTAASSVSVMRTGWWQKDEDEREYQRYVMEERGQDDKDTPPDDYEVEYTNNLIDELWRAGFKPETLRDVEDMLGLSGLEALHDLI